MRMKLQLCPECGTELSAASRVTEKGTKGPVRLTPSEGSLTVCIGCGAVLEFGPEFALRPFNIETLPRYNYRAMLEKVRDAVLEIKRRGQSRRHLYPTMVA